MIRFKIIEPDKHQCYKDLIETFQLDFLSSYRRTLSVTDKEKAIYFIAQDQYQKYLGGAFLLQRSLSQIHKEVRQGLNSLINQSTINPVWICGGIHHCFKPKREQEYLHCISFYQDFYQSLLDFGKQHNVSSVLMRISPKERRLITHFGLWPMQGKIKDPMDLGLIYSYLPLSTQHWDMCHEKQDRLRKQRLSAKAQ